ncbi:MAG: protein kinase [Gammaproteobacteria bacterium]
MNILIVDDQPEFRAMLRELLSAALPEAVVDEVDSDSGSASRLVDHAARSDVVFVDHKLSKVDGIKLLRAIKTRRPQLPVIFLSGGGDEMLVARAFKAGATDYLAKSAMTPDAVRAAVKESLREQQGVARAMRTRAMREAADDIRIKGYRIEYRLARSALSAVYYARDVRGNKVVALKIMQGFANNQSGETLERFLREYESASSLNHRNIVRIHDFGFADDQVYIAMQFIAGGTLRDRLVTETLTDEQCVEVLLQVCEALEAMHRVDILHRDLKPGNVMFHEDGVACVIDFGLARHAQLTQALTVPGRIYGTPYYMSPEQGQGLGMDIRSDLYSLGVMFYEMLCGSKPYAAGSALALVYKHSHAPIPRLPPKRARWQPVIDALMAKKQTKRPATPGDVRELVYACKTL